jgi:CRP-like cAMP-binding protein
MGLMGFLIEAGKHRLQNGKRQENTENDHYLGFHRCSSLRLGATLSLLSTLSRRVKSHQCYILLPYLIAHTEVARWPMLSQIPPDVRLGLMAAGTDMSFVRGQSIHQEGGQDRSLSLIVSGRVRFSRTDRDGTEISASVLTKGDVFGEIPFLTGLPRTHDATAETAVRLIRVPYAQMHDLISRNPAARDWVMVGVGHALARALDLLDSQYRQSASQRLASMLSEACKSGEMKLALRQSDIAVRLNLSRKAVNAALKVLAEQGLVKTGYGQIRILDQSALQAFVNDPLSY